MTPLQWSCLTNNSQISEWLIGRGADVDLISEV